VGQVDQDLDALSDNVVGFVALDAGYETDAAGVVLVAGVIEALRGGETGDTLGFGHLVSPWNALV
jgi:hypothetical protein